MRPSSTRAVLELTFATFARLVLPLSAILAVAAVPVGIAMAFALAAAQLNRHFPAPASFAIFIVAIGALFMLARTAAIVFASEALDGAQPEISTAYHRALGRWPAQLAVGFVFIVAVLLSELVFLTIVVNATGLGPRSLPSPATVGAISVMVGVVYTFADFTWLMASVSVAIDAQNPIVAIGNGFRRTFDRPFMRQTIALAIVLALFEWCCSLFVLTAVQVLVFVTRGAGFVAAVAIVAAAGVVVVEGVRVVLFSVFTREVRFRREGTDLVLACERNSDLPADEDGVTSDDRALIAQFLARHSTLEARASETIAARIAARMRPKLRASFDHLDDVALLEHLARSR